MGSTANSMSSRARPVPNIAIARYTSNTPHPGFHIETILWLHSSYESPDARSILFGLPVVLTITNVKQWHFSCFQRCWANI